MSMKQYGYDIDLSALDEEVIKENYIFALGFPNGQKSADYVVLRCTLRPQNLNLWLYDPIQEGMLSSKIAAAQLQNGISGHTFVEPVLPSSSNMQTKPNFIFKNDSSGKRGIIYQLFFGISPETLRVTLAQPFGTLQNALPIQTINKTYNQFGTINGWRTPLERPTPDSMIWVPPNLDFALGFINDVPEEASPLFMWIINRIQYEVVTDPVILEEVLNTRKYRALKTVGGITSFQYSIQANFGVPPLQLGMSMSQIKNLYSGVKL